MTNLSAVFIEVCLNLVRHNDYILTGGWNVTLRLGQKIKTHYAVRDLLYKKNLNIYKMRYASNPDDIECTNVMDLMVTHNKKCEKMGD